MAVHDVHVQHRRTALLHGANFFSEGSEVCGQDGGSYLDARVSHDSARDSSTFVAAGWRAVYCATRNSMVTLAATRAPCAGTWSVTAPGGHSGAVTGTVFTARRPAAMSCRCASAASKPTRCGMM